MVDRKQRARKGLRTRCNLLRTCPVDFLPPARPHLLKVSTTSQNTITIWGPSINT
jgi:hypothetical protein